MHHVAVDIGQPSLDPVVIKTQPPVIESGEMQDRGMEVVDANRSFDGPMPERVGGSKGKRGFHARSSHPDCEPIGVVVSATGSFLERGHPAEFTAENHEGVLQQATLFEIGEQSGGRLIEYRPVNIVLDLEFLVPIPVAGSLAAGLVTAIEELDEADPLFDQSPGEQAVSGEGGLELIGRIGPVETDH